mgnify:CR=1 FL=1
MSAPRFVVYDTDFFHAVAVLPPGTHRVTVRYDGTIGVVGLVPTNDGWTEWADVPPADGEMRWMRAVADVPAEPEDGARD